MTQDHARRLEKYARGLFGTMTPELGDVLIGMLPPFDPHRALGVLRQHAKNHDHLSLKNLKLALQADDAHFRIGRISSLQQRTVDWIRSIDPQKYQDVEDFSVIHAHYADCWNVVEKCTADPAGKQMIRRMIRGNAKAAGFQIGLNDVDAQELADACIRLAPDEVIPRIEFFNPIPSEEEVARKNQAGKVDALRTFAAEGVGAA